MQLLIDTDVFCKLGVAGLLEHGAKCVGLTYGDCARLATLPYMLRKGRLRRQLGEGVADSLMLIANQYAIAPSADDLWLDRLTSIPNIDSGEAHLLALAAERGFYVVSGDKRALRSVRHVDGFADALTGRVVILEALLIALCVSLGEEAIRAAVQPAMNQDTMIAICFSVGNRTPRVALQSYFDASSRELAPLILWDPMERGTL